MTTLEFKEVITTKCKISYEVFHKNIVKVHEEVEKEVNGKKEYKQFDFFTDVKNVESLDENTGTKAISTKIFVPHLYRGEAYLFMMSLDRYEDLKKGIILISEYEKFLFEYSEREYDPKKYQLVLFDVGSYELTDLDGNYISVPVFVDYMYSNGDMTNQNYDLEEAVKVLNASKKAFPVPIVRNGRVVNKNAEIYIEEIPYYNATEEENKYIRFFFIPDLDVFDYAQRNRPSMDRVSYMLEKTFDLKRK